MQTGWRNPRGIDNRLRRGFKGSGLRPKIGYGSAKATKYMMRDGFYPFHVANVGDLNLLLMHNRKYVDVFIVCKKIIWNELFC